jgi:tetratricopeptide (TPR) repeat protein
MRPTAKEGGVRVPIERPDTASLVRQRLLANADDVDALFVLAALRVQDGYLEEGLTILDRVLRIDPRYPGAWRFKAKLHRMQGATSAEQSARKRAEDTEK